MYLLIHLNVFREVKLFINHYTKKFYLVFTTSLNSLFEHLKVNDVLVKCQADFLPGDSCISQLLCISHEIYKSFDCNPTLETRGVFLDISKAFDRVWHKGLLFKLRSNGIDSPLFNLIENYLHNRKQRVVLNGQTSKWANINAGVPQGSVLGPLLFLYI